MQEQKTDDSTVLTSGATLADVERALKDGETTSVSLYKKNQVVRINGRKFRIGENGHWVPVEEEDE